MKLNEIADLHGKRLTFDVFEHTSFGFAHYVRRPIEGTFLFSKRRYPNPNFTTEVYLNNLNIIGAPKYSKKTMGLSFFNKHSRAARPIYYANRIAGKEKLVKVPLNQTSLTKINGTKLVHLFGLNLNEWPEFIIKWRFYRELLEISSEDNKLRGEVTRSILGSKEKFLTILQKCRAVKKPEDVINKLSDALQEVFKI